MEFNNPQFLKLLIFLIFIFIYLVYKIYIIMKNFNNFFDEKTRKKIFFDISYPRIILKYILLFISFILFIISIARPLGDPIKEEREYTGIDIMFVVDVSLSMAAIDIRPNRMEAVKNGIKRFLEKLTGDRVGMLVFAGIDFVQCPLTIDYEALDLIIDNLYPGMLSKDGTAIGNALKSSINILEKKGKKSKVIILITDGENTEGVSPVKIANLAKKKGIRIYVIGVGTIEGGKIPVGRDIWGRVIFKTYKGEVVTSKLDDRDLKKIAKITGGKYFRLLDRNAFTKINKAILTLEKNKSKIKKHIKRKENYQKYLLLGLILFVLSHVIPVRKFNKNF